MILVSYNIENIPEKNWGFEKIQVFNPNCKEPGHIVTINSHIYYKDVYAFIDWLKDTKWL